MSEVKRYDISAFGGMSMDECSDGAYVNYEDYAALESKCSALLDKIKNMQDQAIDDGCRIAELEEALRDKQALIPDEFDTTKQQFESLAKSE
jgi:predicted  nucleic acid-binding Zn-ribbon protein